MATRRANSLTNTLGTNYFNLPNGTFYNSNASYGSEGTFGANLPSLPPTAPVLFGSEGGGAGDGGGNTPPPMGGAFTGGDSPYANSRPQNPDFLSMNISNNAYNGPFRTTSQFSATPIDYSGTATTNPTQAGAAGDRFSRAADVPVVDRGTGTAITMEEARANMANGVPMDLSEAAWRALGIENGRGAVNASGNRVYNQQNYQYYGDRRNQQRGDSRYWIGKKRGVRSTDAWLQKYRAQFGLGGTGVRESAYSGIAIDWRVGSG